MGKNLYVVYKNEKMYGILPDKEERRLFKEQRDMTDYDILKMPEDDVYEALQYQDIGRFLSINQLGYIMFPFEEFGMITEFERELEEAQNIIVETKTLLDAYVKFTHEEQKLFDLFSILFTYIFAQESSNGVFISPTRKGCLNQELMIKTWLEMVDSGILEDSDI